MKPFSLNLQVHCGLFLSFVDKLMSACMVNVLSALSYSHRIFQHHVLGNPSDYILGSTLICVDSCEFSSTDHVCLVFVNGPTNLYLFLTFIENMGMGQYISENNM